MKFMISPVINEEGVRYIVRKKGLLFWSYPAQSDIFNPGEVQKDDPFGSLLDYGSPHLFATIKEAQGWIRSNYGKMAQIEEWRG